MTDTGDHPTVELDITRSADRDGVVLTLEGELDLSTTPELEHALLGTDTAPLVVLDLSGLSFMDSTGLGLLIAAHERARTAGRELALWRPSPQLRRLFELSGVLGRLTVRD